MDQLEFSKALTKSRFTFDEHMDSIHTSNEAEIVNITLGSAGLKRSFINDPSKSDWRNSQRLSK